MAMKAKDIEWRRVRAELRKGWNDVLHKHYYKALDYRSISFRQVCVCGSRPGATPTTDELCRCRSNGKHR